jgi:hypothetical protein
MSAAHRNIRIGLEGLDELHGKDLLIRDEVSVSGTVVHGPFAQPGLAAQFVSVKRLGKSFGKGPLSYEPSACDGKLGVPLTLHSEETKR